MTVKTEKSTDLLGEEITLIKDDGTVIGSIQKHRDGYMFAVEGKDLFRYAAWPTEEKALEAFMAARFLFEGGNTLSAERWREIAARHGVDLAQHPFYDNFGDSAKLFGGDVEPALQAAMDEYRAQHGELRG
jgi:hypothetical protein